jgi:hypothetical protein
MDARILREKSQGPSIFRSPLSKSALFTPISLHRCIQRATAHTANIPGAVNSLGCRISGNERAVSAQLGLPAIVRPSPRDQRNEQRCFELTRNMSRGARNTPAPVKALCRRLRRG